MKNHLGCNSKHCWLCQKEKKRRIWDLTFSIFAAILLVLALVASAVWWLDKQDDGNDDPYPDIHWFKDVDKDMNHLTVGEHYSWQDGETKTVISPGHSSMIVDGKLSSITTGEGKDQIRWVSDKDLLNDSPTTRRVYQVNCTEIPDFCAHYEGADTFEAVEAAEKDYRRTHLITIKT